VLFAECLPSSLDRLLPAVVSLLAVRSVGQGREGASPAVLTGLDPLTNSTRSCSQQPQPQVAMTPYDRPRHEPATSPAANGGMGSSGEVVV
jgi:hypothetical protein